MRIVSLCPSLTELVFDLGLGDRLVGITRFCVRPADGVKGIEHVGGTKNPKLGRIVDLEPDLVLMNEEENRVEDAEALEAAGLRVHASMPRSVEETAEMIRSIGSALDRRERAEKIAVDVETRARELREATSDARPVRYAYLIWRDPWMAAGPDTYVHGLLSLAGGVNVIPPGGERYPMVSARELAAADPDVVLLSSEPFPFSESHAEELADATGLPRVRFRLVDGELLSWHGSRTGEGIDYAGDVMDEARGEAGR
jgi:ABC-type Fe3+-hydroxamate transport system substrate-binding protein